MKSRILPLLSTLLFLIFGQMPAAGSANDLLNAGIYLIPHPQEVSLGGEDFILDREVTIVLDKNASDQDRFAASELAAQLEKEWGVRKADITSIASGKSIILTHEDVPRDITTLPKKKAQQGYQLTSGADQLVIRAKGEAGLYYGTQTLLQIIIEGTNGPIVPGMEIIDWPDISERAAHYDTKHHQDRREYVESFIRDLAMYKINMLVWE